MRSNYGAAAILAMSGLGIVSRIREAEARSEQQAAEATDAAEEAETRQQRRYRERQEAKALAQSLKGKDQ